LTSKLHHLREQKSALDGFFLGVGVFFPYLGGGINIGVNNTLFSLLLLLSFTIYKLIYSKIQLSQLKLCFLITIFLIYVCLRSSALQVETLFIGADNDYYLKKLQMFIMTVFIPSVFYMVLVPKEIDYDFMRGFKLSIFLISLACIVQIFRHKEYVLLSSGEQIKSFTELSVFSIISYSIILSFACISLFTYSPRSWILIILKYTSCIFLLGLIFVLGQRAHLLMITVMFPILFIVNNGVKRSFLFTGLTVFSLSLLFFSFDMSMIFDGGDERVFLYWSEVFDGSITNSRESIYGYALSEFSTNILGFGFGSFALNYPGEALYPHNIVIESLYELGLLGGFFCISLLIFMLYRVVIIFNGEKASGTVISIQASTICFFSVFIIGHFLKSGSIESSGLLVFFTFLINSNFQQQYSPYSKRKLKVRLQQKAR